MSCPTCSRGLSPDTPRCPDCGASNPLFDTAGSTRSDWTEPVTATGTQAPAAGGGGSDILGFVVLYAETAEPVGPGTIPPALGRVYPLRKGDVFFVGKAPVPNEVPAPDGRKLVPTGWHLFPFTEDYAHISRRHLVIEMDPSGTTTLIDVSTNGIYLLGEARHLRRAKGEASNIHTLTGRESVVLGVDLKTAPDRTARDKAWRYLLQVVPLHGDGSRSLLTTVTKGRRRAKEAGR